MEQDQPNSQPLSVSDRAAALKVALSGLKIPEGTAHRMARWLNEYVATPSAQPANVKYEGVMGQPFPSERNGMVVVKDIDFVALCEHHLLPFHGKAALGYIPDGLLLGLSKTARIVNYFCREPTLQEELTAQVRDALLDVLHPKGAIVVMYDVEHSCMSMRGVKQRHATTTTAEVYGVFSTAAAARAEFYSLIGR